MPEAKPPLTAELVWTGGLRFDATAKTSTVVVDGDGESGPSPMQAMAFAVAGCMGADVVAILQKGRHDLKGMRVSFAAERAQEHPRRFTHITLEFHLLGNLPVDAVERAIALSRQKYCSALLCLREDISVDTRYTFDP